MSISEQISALQTDKTNIRNAILTKGGTSASENGFDDFATDIATIPSGEYNITVTDNGDGTMNLAIVDATPYTDLVPTAINTDGTILDGIGYRRGAYWSSDSLGTDSIFTAIGLIPIDASVVNEIYVKGLSFGGGSHNRYAVYRTDKVCLQQVANLKDGISGLINVTKLNNNYFKLTNAISTTGNIAYFSICGATVEGMTPIVTLNEPII